MPDRALGTRGSGARPSGVRACGYGWPLPVTSRSYRRAATSRQLHRPLWRFIKPVSESSGRATTIVGGNGRTDLKGQTMPDERNVAHDKKVNQDKEDRGEEIAPGAAETPQPGRKPRMEEHAGESGSASEVDD